jgi:hypothetical protein
VRRLPSFAETTEGNLRFGAGTSIHSTPPVGQLSACHPWARQRLVVGTGFEPVELFLQTSVRLAASINTETPDTQLRTQRIGELREVIEAWPKLSAELRTVVLAVTRTVSK